MLRSSKKYHLFFCVLLLAPVLFFFSISSYCQNENNVTDTVKIDTTSQPPAEEVDSTIETETKTNYFLNRSSVKKDLGDTLQLRHVPGTVIKKMKADDDFWYADAPVKNHVVQKNAQANDNYVPLMQREWFQTLLWIVIIGGFAGFIMYYLANSDVGLFRKRNRIIQTSAEEEIETDNIFEINYQKEIDKAIEKGNLRFAVRLMFLRTLKELSGKNIIQYKQDRTNFDYLLQLHSTSYYNDFFKLTRNYEYSWYGQFEVGQDSFNIIKNDFKNFDQKIGII